VASAHGSLALALTLCQAGHIATRMPTYEYGCAACSHEWEEVQRITEAPREVCPKCGARQAHRLISGGTNFILKGGGWYSDLYASPKAEPKKPDANGGSTSDTGSSSEKKKSETKRDTKTQATAEAKPKPVTAGPTSSTSSGTSASSSTPAAGG
jgi:putative FmdB family regulatory protein